MEFVPTRIADVVLIKPRVFEDPRGYFLETWHAANFAAGGLKAAFVQDNHSRSQQWTLRGLHYQLEQPQGKLVHVTRGAAYDVAVDVRAGSATLGEWVGAELSESNRHMLWLPPGFAHGFLALTDIVDCVYKCTDYYAPHHERVIRWDDPTLSIAWPLPAGMKPRVSTRDEQGAAFLSGEYLR